MAHFPRARVVVCSIMRWDPNPTRGVETRGVEKTAFRARKKENIGTRASAI